MTLIVDSALPIPVPRVPKAPKSNLAILLAHIPDLIAVSFLVIYSAIQYHVITHMGSGDDLISARAQDIMLLIVASYFRPSTKKE